MIEYIKGEIAELTPAYVVIETKGGVAYIINISLQTFSKLEGLKETKLLVHENVREDAWSLFGFAEPEERDMFRLLIGVSGVGANTARMLLSALNVEELGAAISTGSVGPIKSVKGIGAKTAQRIIVDLKDKIKPTEATLIEQTANESEAQEEALAALIMLGFNRSQSVKTLQKIFKNAPSTTVENAIKQALAMM